MAVGYIPNNLYFVCDFNTYLCCLSTYKIFLHKFTNLFNQETMELTVVHHGSHPSSWQADVG